MQEFDLKTLIEQEEQLQESYYEATHSGDLEMAMVHFSQLRQIQSKIRVLLLEEEDKNKT